MQVCKRCERLFERCGCEPGRCYCDEGCSEPARKESARASRDKYNARGTKEGREAHAAEEAERRARRAEERGRSCATGREGVASGGHGSASLADVQRLGINASAVEAIGAAGLLGVRAEANRTSEVPPPRGLVPTGRAAFGEQDRGDEQRAAAGVGDQRCSAQVDGLQQTPLAAVCAVVEVCNGPVVRPPAVSAPSVPPSSRSVEWVLVACPELLDAARLREGTVAVCRFCGRRGRIGRVVSLEQWRRWLRRGLEPP